MDLRVKTVFRRHEMAVHRQERTRNGARIEKRHESPIETIAGLNLAENGTESEIVIVIVIAIAIAIEVETRIKSETTS